MEASTKLHNSFKSRMVKFSKTGDISFHLYIMKGVTLICSVTALGQQINLLDMYTLQKGSKG